MNEPIVIARTRKPVKLELKPGDWVILCSPDGTFSDANKAFEKVNTQVSEDYSRILIGKVQHTRPSANPITEEQNKARLSQVSEQSKRVQEIVANAQDRSKKAVEKKELDHKEQIAKDRERANGIAEQVRKSTGYYKQNQK